MKFSVKVILPLLVVFGVIIYLEPRTAKWGYDYRRGTPWSYETLVSQYDFPILKTQQQIDEELRDIQTGAIPYFKEVDGVSSGNILLAEQLELGEFSYVQNTIVNSISDCYLHGIYSESDTRIDSEKTPLLYIQRNKRAVKTPESEVLGLSSARLKLLGDVESAFPDINADSLLRSCSVYDLIKPNLVFDEQSTLLVHSQTNHTVSPTLGYVSAGQLIVSQNEIVTAEIEQMLDSYKVEYESNIGFGGSSALLWAGNVLMALAIIVALYFALFFSKSVVYESYNKYLYVLTVVLIEAVAALLIIRYKENLLFLFPFTIGALYLQAFFRAKIIYPVYIVSLLPLLIFSQSGVMLFMINLVSGIVALFSFKFFGKGAKQFLCALITFGSQAAVFLAFTFVGLASYDIVSVIAMLFLSSILTVALYPFIYLFERIFSLVSRSRLEELADTSNPLLRKLEVSAPGTFQHSLQVMNIATAAGRAVKADIALLRAGALYHDIGKIANPQCFVENESLTSHIGNATYHSAISPLQSATDIIRHVPDGMELAREYRLPEIVSDFIISHHGDNFVAFFYDKFVKEGGDPSLRSEFCYKGRKPVTCEQVILMLSDSLEAASRTLKDYEPKTISDLVENIVSAKIEDGQFIESEISMKKLNVIKEVFKNYLAQIYHERIKYPKRK